MSTDILPIHLGLIIDGNRRWARSNGLTTLEGHTKGYENLQEIAKLAFEKGVKYVSAFVFSAENWSRDKEETSYLMKLALKIAKQDSKELVKQNIRIVRLGRLERVPKDVIEAFDEIEETSKSNTGGTLALCFNYSGQNEISDAVKELISQNTPAEKITPQLISEHLYSPEIPPIDLLIRSSGEQRISDFMLWRASYAELFFADKHWPDFSEADLNVALEDFSKRNRRFGGN